MAYDEELDLEPEDNEDEDYDDVDHDEESDNDSDDEDSFDESELPTLGDMYGYENDDDNEEAALDDILKLQEKGD